MPDRLKWKHSLSEATAITAITNGVIAVIGLATGVMAARLLGPSGRGELAAIQLWPTIMASIAALGMSDALVYFSANRQGGGGRFLTTVWSIVLISAAVTAGLAYVLLPILLSEHSPWLIDDSRNYLWFVPIFVLLSPLYGLLRGAGQILRWNIARALPNLAWLAVLLVAGAIGMQAAADYALAFLCALVLTGFITWTLVQKSVGIVEPPQLAMIAPLLRYGFPAAAISVPQIVGSRLDQLTIVAIAEPRALGLYVVAAAWGGLATPLLGALGSMIFPRVASEGSDLERARLIALTVRTSILIALLAAVATCVSGAIAIPILFGKQFEAAIAPSGVLAWSASICAINFVMEEGLRGLGIPQKILLAEVAGASVTFVALNLLMPTLGLFGAAIATVCGALTTLVWLAHKLARHTGQRIGRDYVPARSDIYYLANRFVQFAVRFR